MVDEEAEWLPWRQAMDRALYGENGFYHRAAGGPGHHYRTSSTASVHFARALLRLAAHVDAALDFPDPFWVVEVAAARGALLTAMQAHVETVAPQLAPRMRLVGVELASRPASLDPSIDWIARLEDLSPRPVGLVVANEWLDNLTVDVVEQTGHGATLVEVRTDGSERTGDPVAADQQRWLDEWWPLCDEGERAEIGSERDSAWLRTVAHLGRGLAVCIDYAHSLPEREAGLWGAGTLTGYRDGRQVTPAPDGSCDLTAHVAIDAVAAAGERGGAVATVVTDQRTALHALGVRGGRPDVELARTDPRGYLQALADAGQQAELVARGGLGDFSWLVQSVGMAIPEVIGPRSPD